MAQRLLPLNTPPKTVQIAGGVAGACESFQDRFQHDQALKRSSPARWLTVTRRREQVVICRVSCYNIRIVIKHKRLRAFFERGDARRLPVALAPRIRRILSDLDAALLPGDMDIPGYRLHPLTGDRRDQWSVRVSGNWRIVFRFMDGVATDVDLIDYH